VPENTEPTYLEIVCNIRHNIVLLMIGKMSYQEHNSVLGLLRFGTRAFGYLLNKT
jgi:hypothetical protein